MKALIVLVILAAVYHYAGAPGLVALGAVAVALILARLRPFQTCPRCRGLGHMRRVIGPTTYCRACHGTGLKKRSQRRKARRLLGDQSGRGARR